jgi:DNA-binding CsgD family transcriptional regulator
MSEGLDAVVGSREHTEISARERQIVENLVLGLSAAEVSMILNISAHTVRTHIRNIYAKIGVSNRVELFRWHQFERG